MKKEMLIGIVFTFALSAADILAQNSNTSPTVRPRTTTTTTNTNKSSADSQKNTDVQRPATTQRTPTRTTPKPKVTATDNPTSQTVGQAFNALLNGIRHADVKAVSSVYWNDPRLILFNNNGSVTKGWEQMRKNRESSYKEMKDALGEPVSSVPLKREAAATESAWWLRTVVSTGDKGIEAVESSFASLARGREAAGERDSERFTGFDGYVPDAGKVLDPCAAGNAFSVTDLEGAAGCPYRFFLKRGLGLRALDEGERDKDVWLDPST